MNKSTVIIEGKLINIYLTGNPTPHLAWDWQAILDKEDTGDPEDFYRLGWGSTPDEAVQDLLRQLED
jgi:hypothetical protein